MFKGLPLNRYLDVYYLFNVSASLLDVFKPILVEKELIGVGIKEWCRGGIEACSCVAMYPSRRSRSRYRGVEKCRYVLLTCDYKVIEAWK